MSAVLHETYDHWSVAVLTVTVHSSFVPTFEFKKNMLLLDKLIKEGKRKLARRFNLSYRYIDDLISFNNKRFKEFISDIYPK